MKKNWKLLIFLLWTLLLTWKNYVPKKIMVGKYVNNNTASTLEGPRSINDGRDTLILFENNTFKSRTWGEGTYEIELGFWKKEIDLSYTYEMGKAGYSAHITKSFFGKPRIWLNLDLGFYFEKID